MENLARILLIEDDADVAANVAEYLEARSAELDFAYDGAHGLELATAREYSLIVLDLSLPRLDGIEVCRRLRDGGCPTPILMLTARDALSQKIVGFEAGADDYLVKPFALPELYARVCALLRRAEPEPSRVLRVHDLELDVERPEIRRGGRALALNRIELKILETLARASPAFVTREQLESAVWGDDLVRRDLLRSYVYRIRREIDRPFDEPLLQTVHGQGYALRRERE